MKSYINDIRTALAGSDVSLQVVVGTGVHDIGGGVANEEKGAIVDAEALVTTQPPSATASIGLPLLSNSRKVGIGGKGG